MTIGSEAEAARVRKLLRRDRMDRIADQTRREADIAVKSGDLSRLQDTVVPPTPEQLGHGEFVSFSADKGKGTVRSATTVRRVVTPIAQRLWRSGKIDDDQLAACKWYRDRFEASGLDGRVPSTDFSKEVFAAPNAREMFTDHQVEAEDDMRFVRKLMTAQFVKFFDMIVIGDVTLKRAERAARVRSRGGLVTFRECAAELVSAREVMERG